MKRFKNILYFADQTVNENATLERAAALAQRESAHLHVVHAWRLKGETMLLSGRASIPPGELKALLHSTEHNHRQKLNVLLTKYGLTTESRNVVLVKASATGAIVELSEEINADLTVMGTVGRIDISGVSIGNTAEEVLQTTKSSVLAIKPSGFENPVTTSQCELRTRTYVQKKSAYG